ncbi:hypothetical protein DPMN_085728 [Dreissena polymorpha]|uniref:Uncharacterized protein n=1 Tax=Dreissena polymorpha TaxID=45954 RepID=A0A9D3YHJ0_DREPO|nr:hypothetical protein DPMN_085728 [Dreissena polymorpha]
MVYDQTNHARWGPVYLADIKALEYEAPEVFKEYTEVHEEENRLFSIASKDVDIRDELLICESRCKTLLKEFVEKRLKEQNIEFYAPIQKRARERETRERIGTRHETDGERDRGEREKREKERERERKREKREMLVERIFRESRHERQRLDRRASRQDRER